jgi:hypothetical protein
MAGLKARRYAVVNDTTVPHAGQRSAAFEAEGQGHVVFSVSARARSR